MPSPARARAAVTAVFFLNGAVFVSWYARLPAIQDDLGLGAGELGLALLGAPVGLLLAQPLAGALAARRGSRPLVAAAPLYMAAVVLPALAVDAPTLALAVLTVGAANGILDIAMNVQGLAVERAAGRTIFNSLHAAFSFGALGGAGCAAAAAAAGMDPLPHLAVTAGAGAATALLASRYLLPAEADAQPGTPLFARPSRRLAALGAVAFAALLAEGAVFDWSGIYMDDEAGSSEALAPAALAAFSGCMGIGRLAADRLVTRRGSPAVAGAGALLAAAGLGLALVTANPPAAISGFALMGAGLSAVFPLALRAAGSAGSTDLAAVSTVGYAGFLAGPPLIGLVAEASSLRAALSLICLLLVLVRVLTPQVRAPAVR
jgi:predicted MFS family arabinose efflux permease